MGHSSFQPPFDNWQFNGNMPIPQTWKTVDVSGLGEVEVPILILVMKSGIFSSTDGPAPGPAVQLFPNPTSGVIRLAGVTEGSRIEVVDAQGRLLPITIWSAGSEQYDIRLPGPGLVWVRLRQDGQIIWQEKVVVMP